MSTWAVKAGRSGSVLEFDGVMRNASFWYNGCFIGDHYSGYTGFQFDVTELTKYGAQEGDNVILVRCDTTNGNGNADTAVQNLKQALHLFFWADIGAPNALFRKKNGTIIPLQKQILSLHKYGIQAIQKVKPMFIILMIYSI